MRGNAGQGSASPGRPRPPRLSPPQPSERNLRARCRAPSPSLLGPVPPHPRPAGEGCARRESGEAGQPMLGRVRSRASPARKQPRRQPRGAPGRRPAANPDLSACHMKTITASAGGGEEKLKAARRRSRGRWRPPPSRRPQWHMHPTGQTGSPSWPLAPPPRRSELTHLCRAGLRLAATTG